MDQTPFRDARPVEQNPALMEFGLEQLVEEIKARTYACVVAFVPLTSPDRSSYRYYGHRYVVRCLSEEILIDVRRQFEKITREHLTDGSDLDEDRPHDEYKGSEDDE